MSALFFVVLVLAAYRISRFITTDDWPPVEFARSWLLRRWEDSVWASGLICHWCIGSIVAGSIVAGLAQIRSVELPGLWALAVAAGVGIVGEFVE